MFLFTLFFFPAQRFMIRLPRSFGLLISKHGRSPRCSYVPPTTQADELCDVFAPFVFNDSYFCSYIFRFSRFLFLADLFL